MKKYTIGILFNESLTQVVMIYKNRPDWQKDNFNFPGGHIENGETSIVCLIREFEEECAIKTTIDTWKYIGKITNNKNYYVDVFTAIHNPKEHGFVKTNTDEVVIWIDCNNIPENIVTNVSWLLPFAKDWWNQGNVENLSFGTFNYNNIENCENCNGEGYTNFYDQGEPDLDSKCTVCNGTGKK